MSYRRADALGTAHGIHRELLRVFRELDGSDDREVFLDIDDIEPGDDYREVIDATLGRCAYVMVVIGPRWATATDDQGRRRLDSPTDTHALEIASALESDAVVIPVLVEGATMPTAEELPERIAELGFRNAWIIDHRRFEDDVANLAGRLVRRERLATATSAGAEPVATDDRAPTLDATGEATDDLSAPTTGGPADEVVGAELFPRAPVGPQIEVSIVHGSLENSRHPVLIGHYRATPLSSAEAFVERRFAGRLSDRLDRSRYSGRIGESLAVSAPRRRHPSGGVLVVGLGEYGELTPLGLVATIRQALVDHALIEAERIDDDDLIELEIGTVLLGTSGAQGLSVSSSVRAIVTAVREANRELQRGELLPPQARFHRLRIWEQMAPEAELALGALLDLDLDTTTLESGGGRGVPDVVVPARELAIAPGAMDCGPRPGTEDWPGHRLRISDLGERDAAGEPASSYLDLEFSTAGELGRAAVVHRVERRRLERLLRGAVAAAAPPLSLHMTLFELLMPNQLKWQLMDARDVQLEIDDVTADIPWEMLAPHDPDQVSGPLALRASIVRRVRLPDLPPVRRATHPTALVIGNPPAGRLGPPSRGAYTEAMAVSEALSSGGFAVRALCYDADQYADDTTTSQIEAALFDDDYRIVHIAAHGLFQPDDPTRTGVVIGPDDVLTGQVFRQLNVIPELVFLDCGHLVTVAGDIEAPEIEFTRTRLNRLGATLARQLLDAGVRAVVVAGWAVDDAAAAAFARRFYGQLLRGRPLSRAVHAARHAAFSTAPGHSTWGAYQCYGDGTFRLPGDADESTPDVGQREPITSGEAARRVSEIVQRVESIGPDEGVAQELVLVEEAAWRHGWIGGASGRLCEQLGHAWAVVGDFERSLALLAQAASAMDGSMTLRGIERTAVAKERLGCQLVRMAGVTDDDRSRAAALSDAALRDIELLELLSASGERSALRAGHHTRRAVVMTGPGRAAALADASATSLASFEQNPHDHALFLHVQLEEIRARTVGEHSAATPLHDELGRRLTQLQREQPSDYWQAVARADGAVALAIAFDEVPDRAGMILSAYTEAFDGRSTSAQRSSTLDHLQNLTDLHPDHAQAAGLAAIVDALVDRA